MSKSCRLGLPILKLGDGGRVFATHYNYTWLYDDSPFSTTAKGRGHWPVSCGRTSMDKAVSTAYGN